LINTNLPAGVPVGSHGTVISEPEEGMFYETFNAGTRFYRIADLNLTDSETLVSMYGVCKEKDGNVLMASRMLEELKQRKKEDYIKKFFLGELEVKP
jgi:hypothetical protein